MVMQSEKVRKRQNAALSSSGYSGGGASVGCMW
jgi:hypothetical protein